MAFRAELVESEGSGIVTIQQGKDGVQVIVADLDQEAIAQTPNPFSEFFLRYAAVLVLVPIVEDVRNSLPNSKLAEHAQHETFEREFLGADDLIAIMIKSCKPLRSTSTVTIGSSARTIAQNSGKVMSLSSTVDGSSLPKRELPASLVRAGKAVDGPVFLVYNNYRVTLKWNRSTFFAVAVGTLAERIKGH